MRRKGLFFAALLLVVSLCACGQNDRKAGNRAQKISTQSVSDVLAEQMKKADGEKTPDTTGTVISMPDPTEVLYPTDGENPLAIDENNVLDLTTLSSTMVYTEVNNFYIQPEDYCGVTVKMQGVLSCWQDPDTGAEYYSCIVQDATACCANGIEFVLKDGNYPEIGTEVTVVGVFETYFEGEDMYCHLQNAELL